MLLAATACTFSTSQLPKVFRSWCVLHGLTWKRALPHSGVHFFDISTSKSAPKLVCFARFDLETCFAPQRHALFGHLNFKNPKMVPACSKCASRHNGVQLSSLIWPDGSAPAALASLLCDPPGPQSVGKT